MPRKIYELNTTAGKRFAVGVFDDKGELQAGRSPKYFKTKEGAEKELFDFD